ncbi:hypothetical protein BJX76DRAFT_352283 [Aspergillus varians]
MDHETSGAQEWQLPGYGRAAPKKNAVPLERQTESPSRNTTPQSEPYKQPPTGPKTPGPSSRPLVMPRGTPNVRGRRAAKGRATPPRGAGSGQSSSLFRDPPAKAKWRNGSKPGGVVQLPAAFGAFKHEFFGTARLTTFVRKGTTGNSRNVVFEDISKRTGAFVSPPAYTDQIIQIWGEPNQIAAAEEQLKAIIAKCHSLSKPKNRGDWTKINAYSVKKEVSAEYREKGENMLHEFRKSPEGGITPPEQLLFLWPKDGPSLHECLGPELESLDSIRAMFGCHLFVPKDLPGYICALGHNHDGMKQIAESIRILWAETVAKSNIKAKIYLLEPPEPNAVRGKIVVKRQNQLHKPALQGPRLGGHDLQKWQDGIDLVQSRNNTRLLTAVENCLKGVSFVRGHLRMRVNLGTFVLENYRVPEDDKSWYGFEEFREMLLHEQTKGRLIPGLKVGQSKFLERCFTASHLFEPCDGTSTSLESAELAYSVNFEFLGADKSMLRLEAEFSRSPGAREYEIRERRWLRPRTGGETGEKRPPLHVAIIDFERSDWQLEIKSLEFHETSSIDTALKAFSHSIGFRRTENMGDISAKPERKVIFPASPPVSRLVEKSAIRYRMKGTKYIFEIARYDEYRRVEVPITQTGAMITGAMSEVPYTSWGASIFEANWDNLLGEHANLPVGHSAKYSPKLATFFPPKEPSPEDQTKGFWEFINLVKQAAELLGPTRTSSEATDVDIASNPESSSVKASSSKNEAISLAEPALTTEPGSAGMLNADLGTLF